MATITSLGTGSGLQLESLITKLMTAESVSLTTLQKKESSYQTKISAMGTLQNSLSSLQTAAQGMSTSTLQTATQKFASYTAKVADTTIASATASTGAVAGSYPLEVSQLAQSQKLQSSVFSSATSSVVSSDSSLKLELGSVSSGTFTANSTFNISLSSGATLQNVRDAINASGAGVTATIIHGTSGYQMVVSGPEGSNNVMQLSGVSGFTYDPTSSANTDFSQTQAAQDAAFKLNGVSATSHSNTVSDALDGVTLQLTGITSSATTLTITQDVSTNVTKALQSFVSAYNSTYSTMTSLGAYDPSTKVAGDLQGNSTLRYAMSQLRSAVTNTTSGNTDSTYQRLSSIGVTISDTGSLTIDSAKLSAALADDPTTVSNLVANVGSAFNTTVNNLIGTDGSVTVATSGLKKTVTDIQSQETKMQDRLTAIEARYRQEFSALDTTVASLNSTGDFLTNYISSLNKKN